MRVLVTGGAGYVGSVLGDVLASAGHTVVVCDDLSGGHRDAVPRAATFVHANLLDTRTVADALRTHRIDVVMHLAARSLVDESIRDPAACYRDNVGASLSLLDAMRAAEVRGLVFSSSASVYGAPEKQPIEESDPAAPVNAYGETKLAIERALPWYERAYGLRWIGLRYFNAAGAGERCGERHDPETHLVPLVLQSARGSRGPVVIHGADYPTPDGTCIRDYVHVLDLCSAHVLAAESLARGGASAIYNVGGGKGHSVREVIRVAEEIVRRKEIVQRPVRVVIGDRRAGDPAVLVASSKRIERELGWRPERDLRAIVEDAWRFMAGGT